MSGNPTTSPLVAGVTITSTSTPSLNGTYRATSEMVGVLQGQAAAVAMNNSFADGTASLNWPDVGGTMHAFDVAQFKPFAAAMFNYVSLYTMWGLGKEASAPANTATIP